MRALKLMSFVFAGALVVGCGGGQSKGDSDKSSYEQLQELEGNLTAAMDKVVGPIDQVDTMIDKFTNLPTKYQLTPADFKAFVY